MRTVFFLIAVTVASAAAPVAQEPAAVPCRFCDSHGAKDCKDRSHRGVTLVGERALEFCSVAAACRKCRGALTVDCKICDNRHAQDSAAQRKKLVADWLDARRAAVDAKVPSRSVLHAKSAHVDLAFAIKPLQVGRRKLDTHRLMHLYIDRIEALRTLFLEVMEAPADQFEARLQIYMFRDKQDHAVLSPRVAGGGANATGMKLMGVDAIYCMYHEENQMPGDDGLHRAIVHNVTHLLLSNMKPEYWLGNRKHGWVDEGVAHWFEDRLTGRCQAYCVEEVGIAPGGGFKGGKWRVPMRRLVEAGKLEPFAAVSALNTDQLTGQQHAQVFAYVDFLLDEYGGKKFSDMVRRLKKGEPTRDALREAFGLTTLGFDAAFSIWVRGHYPLR